MCALQQSCVLRIVVVVIDDGIVEVACIAVLHALIVLGNARHLSSPNLTRRVAVEAA